MYMYSYLVGLDVSILVGIFTNFPSMKPQGFGRAGEKGHLFLGSLGALAIILGELESKYVLLEF